MISLFCDKCFFLTVGNGLCGKLVPDQVGRPALEAAQQQHNPPGPADMIDLQIS